MFILKTFSNFGENLRDQMSDVHPSLYILIGKKIKYLRTLNGLNQEDLSKMVGIGRTSISNIELGRHQAPLHLIYRICCALKAEIHSVIPTFREINEASESADSDLLRQLHKVILGEESKKQIEDYLSKITHHDN